MAVVDLGRERCLELLGVHRRAGDPAAGEAGVCGSRLPIPGVVEVAVSAGRAVGVRQPCRSTCLQTSGLPPDNVIERPVAARPLRGRPSAPARTGGGGDSTRLRWFGCPCWSTGCCVRSGQAGSSCGALAAGIGRRLRCAGNVGRRFATARRARSPNMACTAARRPTQSAWPPSAVSRQLRAFGPPPTANGQRPPVVGARRSGTLRFAQRRIPLDVSRHFACHPRYADVHSL